MNKRYWEIDFFRGIAIIMMIIYHFFWDVNYFYNTNIPLRTGFWGVFQIITASLFIFLVGLSMTISSKKTTSNFAKYLKRGTKVFCLGLIITIATYFIFPKGYIMFGILHFIGIAIILSYPLTKLKYTNIVLGLSFIMIGNVIKNITTETNWLMFLGLKTSTFFSVDYFPLFPWFGVVLLGMFVGNVLYTSKKRNFKLNGKESKSTRPICFLGKHSLLIYMTHQIVLFSLFYLVKIVI